MIQTIKSKKLQLIIEKSVTKRTIIRLVIKNIS